MCHLKEHVTWKIRWHVQLNGEYLSEDSCVLSAEKRFHNRLPYRLFMLLYGR